MSERGEHPVPPSSCPYCGHSLDTAGNIDGEEAVPTPGDATVCIDCASVLVFDDDLRVRAPWPGEIADAFAADPEGAETLRRVQRAIRMLDRRKPGDG